MSIPSWRRTISAAIQFTGAPKPEKRPWTITKSPPATMTPASYFSVGGRLLMRLNRPSRPMGHLGEMLPYAIWRAEHRTKIDPRGLSLKKDLSLYFYENFYITTSGNFRTQALINCILEMGSDRILDSTDYPFESMEECDQWFSGVDIALADQYKIG